MPREAGIEAGGVSCRLLYDEGGRGLVVFLHGYSFQGRTWYEAGIAGSLARRGYRVAAPDMPYGRSTSCTRRTRSIDLNLALIDRVVETLAPVEDPVLVGASLGGRVALYYALSRRVRGLFLAAPFLRAGEDVWEEMARLRGVPAAIVWGTRDRVVPRSVAERLAETLGAKLIVYEGAGHAPYLDRPREFTRDLEAFLERVMGSR